MDADRRRAEVEAELSNGSWLDPRRGEMKLEEWAVAWVETRHDLRATTWARLRVSMDRQVLPRFGSTALAAISNADVRSWVAEMIAAGLSAATVRKAVFALRQCLSAAVADRRLMLNPASAVPLPSESATSPLFLSQAELERLVEKMPERYRALVLVGAYAGLRWGEAVGLTRRNVDVFRSRIIVESTAVEVAGKVMLGQAPKTKRSRRTIPVARSVMRRIDEHLTAFVDVGPGSLLFTASKGGPLFRGTFGRHVWHPAVAAAGLDGFTFHGLRHSFVAILVAAGCNVREVSEWAGHNSVAFTLTRYGGLFEDGSAEAVDRLDALLGFPTAPSAPHGGSPDT
ncbi:tyrosine-type recombinase/integrase [uncultured Friedmanniella sp.]|uniref:tyrosine-type recombinase/integrase n=1 Tax=uncultured Friedmanniella sp. TaxID=335381 RepID=UPI0035CA5796